MDFNFFEPYTKVPVKTNFIRLAVTSVLLTLILGILAITGFTVFEVATIKKEIATANEILESQAHKGLLTEFASLNIDIRLKSLEKQSYDYFRTYMTGKDLIKRDSLGKIAANINDAIYLESIVIEDKQMAFKGKSFKTKSLADLETVLRDSGEYEEVFLRTTEQTKRDKTNENLILEIEDDDSKIIKNVYDFTLEVVFVQKESLDLVLENIIKINEEEALAAQEAEKNSDDNAREENSDTDAEE